MSGWTAISFRYPSSLEDVVVAILQDAGTLGMHLGESESTAYFGLDADLGSVRRALETLEGAVVLGAGSVPDERWVERQQEDRCALRIGRRFEILPAAEVEPEAGGMPRIRIVIPPQRAFGTGEHATTRLCLERIEDIPLRGARVLDLGTGSGILAMAAERLGAREIVALDHDPEAIEVARDNLALNGCERIQLEVGDLSRAQGMFDLIVSNIYAGVLGDLAGELALRQEGSGRALLSGFSPEEAEDLERRLTEHGYRRETLAESGEWAALVMNRATGARA